MAIAFEEDWEFTDGMWVKAVWEYGPPNKAWAEYRWKQLAPLRALLAALQASRKQEDQDNAEE